MIARASCLVFFATVWIVAASATDLNQCATIDDDGRRLACYDNMAGRIAPNTPSAQDSHETTQDEIFERCRREMTSYGSAMVKACIDQDIDAYQALQDYPTGLFDMVDRCKREMGTYGWSMVKACADQDIDAYQALQSYPTEFFDMVDRCKREMGTYGWSMVKACADQDIEAERALSEYD